MSALDRLKEKVERWKERIAQLEEENRSLRERLEGAPGEESADAQDLRSALEACRETVTVLEKDIADKDLEIDAIIAKVEALID